MAGFGTDVSPLGAVGRGLFAGVVGTAAMTAWQELAAKLQSSGEESESSSEEDKDLWEEASTPAKAAKKISEGVFDKEVSADKIPLLTNAMHWGYGTAWGAVFGLLAGTAGRATLGGGLAFGTGVWLASYAQLVPMVSTNRPGSTSQKNWRWTSPTTWSTAPASPAATRWPIADRATT